jgi:hypothetical protein
VQRAGRVRQVADENRFAAGVGADLMVAHDASPSSR